jgi:hypothetical protein
LNLHFEALGFLGIGLAILYLCGAWVTERLISEEDRDLRWAWTPLFGMVVFMTAVSNLNYLGVAVKVGAPITILGCAVLTYWFRPRGEGSRYFGVPFVVALASALLFLGPYAFTGAFAFYGDEFTYVSIADFIRDHGYFASPEPVHETPWKSQMFLYQYLHLRMGTQYLLAGVAAIPGVQAVSAFVPVTALCLYCCFCAMWLLARTVLAERTAQWVAYVLFSTNLMLLHWPAANNFLPQTAGMAMAIAFLAAIVRLGEPSIRPLIVGGLMFSGLCLAYAELLPIWVLIAGAFTLGLLVVKEVGIGGAIQGWVKLVAVAVLLNPYTFYYSIAGVVSQSSARPGFDVPMTVVGFLRMAFGLIGPVDLTGALATAAAGVAVAMGLVTVLGVSRLAGRGRVLVLAGLLVLGALEAYFLFGAKYSYGAYKILLFGYFLVPLLFGAGLMQAQRWLPGASLTAVVGSLFLGWAGLAAIVEVQYLRSGYDTARHAFYAHPKGSGHFMEYFSDLEKISKVVQPGQRTLQFIPEDHFNKWASYFFREPVGLYFRGPFFSSIANRPMPPDTSYSYLLMNRKSAALQDPELVLYQNELLTFSRVQSFISYGETGWFDWEQVNGKPMRWMANRAEMVAFSPGKQMVTLSTKVYLGPDGKKKNLIVSRDGKELSRVLLTEAANTVVFRNLELAPGFQKLTFETDVPAQKAGGDPRVLNLLFEAISMQGDPTQLLTSREDHRRLLQRLSGDSWVLAEGIATTLGARAAGPHELLIRGSVPGLSAVLPQQLMVEAGAIRKSVTIVGGGPFSVSVPLGELPAGGVPIQILPSKSFTPRALKINDDPRALAFQLDSLELKRQ